MSSRPFGLSRLRQAIPGSREARSEPHAKNGGASLATFRAYEDAKLGWFWSTDAQGQLTYASRHIAQELGQEPGDLIGQPFAAVFGLDPDRERAGQRTLPFLLGTHTSFIELTACAAGRADGRSEEHTSELQSR